MVENWTALVIGIIMIVSPWVLGFSDISLAKWCNILLGLALVLMNAWTIFGEPPQQQTVPSVEETSQKKKRKIKNNIE